MSSKKNNNLEVRIFCADLERDIIPNSALAYLPFKKESMKDWDENSDLRKFLSELYNFDSQVISNLGQELTVNMSWFGYKVYENNRYEFIEQGKYFYANVYAALNKATENNCKKHAEHYSQIDNFFEDKLFGQSGKYFIAWNQLVQRATEDSFFFSIAHVLESLDDLKCSFHLAANFYYKQAAQTLRNFIEDLILPIQFCENPQEYLDWKSNNYRVPSLRGKNGLLKKLRDKQLLSDQLANKVSDIYGKLSEFVHGSENRLINKGRYSSNWDGHVFQKDSYLEWCNLVCRSIEIGIYLLKINLDQWQKLKSKGVVICAICHSQNKFNVTKESFNKVEFNQYGCQLCGHTMLLDRTLNRVVSISGE